MRSPRRSTARASSFTITYTDAITSAGLDEQRHELRVQHGSTANGSVTIASQGSGNYLVTILTTQFTHLGTFSLNISIVSWTKPPFYSKVSIVDSS